MKKLYPYFTLFLLLIIIACNSPKSLTKKGNQLYNAGMYNEATDYFLRAIAKRPDYVEAKTALKMCADKVMDVKEDTFFVANNRGDWGVVVYTYLDMQKYVEKVRSGQVNISIAGHYTEDYEIAKSNYLDERFRKANALLEKENFSAAESIFNEISSLDPNYKDVEQLKKYARIEPIYRKGVDAMKREKYRAAFYAFQNIVNRDASYKDAAAQMSEALTQAQYTVAFMRFNNYTSEIAAAEQLSSRIINTVIGNKGPFLKVIDRQHLDLLLKEQKLSMTGAVDATTAVNAGNLIGAKAVVMGSVLDLKYFDTPVSGKTVKGYESYRVQRINPQTNQPYFETNYKKVTYSEFQGSRQVTMSFEYKMVSATTGEVLLSGIKTLTQNSSVHYVQYSGNRENLYPGTWYSMNVTSPQDVVYNNFEQKNQIQNLLKSSTALESKESLLQKLYDQISSSVAQEIYSYNPEK
ncbi:MAG: CsgG/HfaB family protein [Flavobacteriales bacterium]